MAGNKKVSQLAPLKGALKSDAMIMIVQSDGEGKLVNYTVTADQLRGTSDTSNLAAQIKKLQDQLAANSSSDIKNKAALESQIADLQKKLAENDADDTVTKSALANKADKSDLDSKVDKSELDDLKKKIDEIKPIVTLTPKDKAEDYLNSDNLGSQVKVTEDTPIVYPDGTTATLKPNTIYVVDSKEYIENGESKIEYIYIESTDSAIPHDDIESACEGLGWF